MIVPRKFKMGPRKHLNWLDTSWYDGTDEVVRLRCDPAQPTQLSELIFSAPNARGIGQFQTHILH
jgi:hypothetical protein